MHRSPRAYLNAIRTAVYLLPAALASACSPGAGDGNNALPDASIRENTGDADVGQPDGGSDSNIGNDSDGASGPISVSRLRTEYRQNPLGTDVAQPRFDYQLDSSIRGEKQTAYRILVSSSESGLAANQGDLWDSGKVTSDQTSQIVYGGPALSSRQTAWWKVQVWDKDDVASGWSASASWEAGLLAPTDWVGTWITTPVPAPLQAQGLDWIWYPEGNPAVSAPSASRLFRRVFTIAGGAAVHSAKMAISADNIFDLWINGTHIGSGSDWHTLHHYDVTSLITPGANTIAILATNVDANSPAGVIGQLAVDVGVGAPILISTDDGFKSSNQSPPPQGWQSTSFADSAWSAATIAAPYGGGPWGSGLSASGGGPARYARKSFTLASGVKRARLYVTALGLYEARINGTRVGNQHITPGWTDYNKRVEYQTYDVTAFLVPGENVIGLLLGDGWYQGKVGYGGRGRYGSGPVRALAQLEVALADGTQQVVGTDGNWDATDQGPINADDLLDGETYDARSEMPGWSAKGFTPGSAWGKAVVSPPSSAPRLVPQVDDGITVEKELSSLTVKEMPSGSFIFDLGQNMVGWTRLKVNGAAGATIVLRHGEVLNPDGTLYTTNLRGAAATDSYTLRGGGDETYEPTFTMHGFRYVEISGDVAKLSTKPTVASITGVVPHAATAPVGSFETSDTNVNQLQSNIVWSQKDNFTAVPTDCPQRDERLGWMGDAQIFARTATLNMDVAAFYTKWLRDVDEAQLPNGAFTDVSPNPASISGQGTPAWGDAGVIVPWTVYLAYGDTRILHENYPAMKAWVDYISGINPNHLWQASRGSDYGDWLNVGAETDKEVLATAFFAHSTEIVAKAATVLGNTADATKYGQLFEAIKSAFNSAYVSSDGHIRSNTQTAYALAIRFGLLSSAQVAAVGGLLKADIAKHNGYLTTGFLGVGHLLPALSAAGMTDTAYGLLQNDGYPSWRYEIAHGATTIWERWDGIRTDGSFQDPTMNSFNHYSFGSVDEWMYSVIGGLELDEAHPGWRAFRVRPRPGGGLTSAKAAIDSICGKIVSDWKIENGTFTLSVTIPVNSQATVYMPYANSVTLDGKVAPAAGSDGGYVLGSGTYVFTAKI